MDELREVGKQLHNAAKLGKIDEIALLINQFGYSSFINYVDEDLSQSILHVAAAEGHLPLVEWLIKSDQPIAINARDKNGWTPLHCACDNYRYDVIKKLIQNGADPTLMTSNQSTPLHYLAKNNLFDVEKVWTQKFGNHRASMRGSISAPNLAALACPTDHPSSPSSQSTQHHHHHQSPPNSSPPSSNHTSTILAAPPSLSSSINHISSLRTSGTGLSISPKKQQQLNPQSSNQQTPNGSPLNPTSSNSSPSRITTTTTEWRHSSGDSKSSYTKSDGTKSRSASDMSSLTILVEELLDLFMSKGADINARNSTGETVLHKSCFYGWRDNIQIFLRKGASSFILTKHGESCIDYALRGNHSSIVEILMHEMPDILRMPNEILAYICHFLPTQSLLSLSRSCTRFRRLMNDDHLWQKKCQYLGLAHRKATNVNWKTFYEQWRMGFNRYDYITPCTKLEDNEIYDFLFPVLCVGDSNVGKSSTIIRFLDDTFFDEPLESIGGDFRITTLSMGDKIVKLQVWDSERRERSRSLADVARFRGAKCIIVFFDVTNAESFTHVRQWIQEVNRYGRQKVIKVVVGTKTDLEDKRVVPFKSAIELCDQENVPYIEVSSRNKHNIELLFSLVAHHLVESVEMPELATVEPTVPTSHHNCIVM